MEKKGMLIRIRQAVPVMIALYIGSPICKAAIPPPLPNFGGTCYLNATLQCVHNLPRLNQLLTRGTLPQHLKAHEDRQSEYPLVYAFAKTLQALQNPQNITEKRDQFQEACNTVTQQMQRITGTQNRHQDATELFTHVVGGMLDLSENFGLDKVQKELNALLLQEYTLTLHPLGQKHNILSQRRDNEYTLNITSFPEAQYVDLSTLIHKQFSPVTVEDYPEKGKVSIEQSFLTHVPTYFVITLQRYKYDLTGTPQQRDHTIDIPKRMTFTTQAKADNTSIPILSKENTPIEQATYQLNSACIYTGDKDSGHYWAYVWASVPEEKARVWFRCDDTNIAREPFPSRWTLNNPFPYVLFYELQDYTRNVHFFQERLQQLYVCLDELRQAVRQ